MKKISIILISVLSLVSVFSCKKSEMGEGYGYLYVNLDEDDSEELVMKSTPAEDQVFSVTIYNSLGQQVAFVEDYREIGSGGIELRSGNFEYTALASSGDESKAAAFDEPFYSGTEGFRIETGKQTSIDIVCSLANVKVTADFSEIEKYFKTYSLTVSNGLGELVFSNAAEPSTAEREGFFSVTDELSWRLDLVNNDGADYKELSGVCKDVKANQHYTFKFSLADEDAADGAGAVTVTIDDSMEEHSIDMDLDFADETLPEVSTDFGYDGKNPVSITAGDATSRKLTLTTADGFKSILLSYGPSGAGTKVSGVAYELVEASAEVLSALRSDGISVAESVVSGVMSVEVTLTDYIKNLATGSYSINLFMVDINDAFTEQVIVLDILSNVDVEAVSVNPWARFATVEAKWYPVEQPEGVSFQWRKASDPDWKDFTGNVSANPASRTYSADIRGLEPETEYVFRAVTVEDKETKVLSFTTEKEETLHNMSFDYWWTDGKAPMPNQSSEYHIWDSANPGTASFGITPTVPEETHLAKEGEGKKAAKLVSQKASLLGGLINTFAAGNLYTGSFVKAVVNPQGAELDWGVPFNARPIALKGYFDYLPQTVNYGEEDMLGKTDICQIQIMLTDWDEPFHVNTSTSYFVDPAKDPGIIAYGCMEYGQATEGYKEFTIKLDYRSTERTPKYIVIVAAASKYGDYFTGGDGSTLYLDEFKFVYDPDELD